VKLLKWLDENFEEKLAMCILGAMVIIMGIQIFMRYVVGYSLSWPEELTRYCFIWLTFSGTSYAFKEKIHLRIDITEKFIPVLQKPLGILGNICGLLFCIYLIKPGLLAIVKIYKFNQKSTALLLPMYLVYSSMMFAMCFSVFRILQSAFRSMRNNGKSKTVAESRD
jgi:TRAP-type C4-dicarboxylate transport system permease small subunit